jgi:hypothetical protein
MNEKLVLPYTTPRAKKKAFLELLSTEAEEKSTLPDAAQHKG